mmetsp:Transcript_8707/g.23405  ORF Transcript_8707/g.23405 Transcript_8707/m.23405 type:complete len:90 (-) Transcript_8707:1119-1388(-)
MPHPQHSAHIFSLDCIKPRPALFSSNNSISLRRVSKWEFVQQSGRSEKRSYSSSSTPSRSGRVYEPEGNTCLPFVHLIRLQENEIACSY